MIAALKSNRRVYEQSYIRTLFDTIASRYDLLNHILSLGIDVLWRKRAIRLLQPYQPQHILDVATGTGDVAFEASRLKPQRIIGIDISSKMLEIGKAKVHARNLQSIISFEKGEAEQLRFESNSFDAVTVAFGVRNFSDLKKGLSEFYRVLRDGGIVVIVEFSKPRIFPIAQVYNWYSQRILPWLGGLISKNRSAYEYLPHSISEFPDSTEFCTLLTDVGFTDVQCHPQTFGIASIYVGMK